MPAKKKLGEILLASGIITETQLKAALSEQQIWGGRLGTHLVNMGLITEEQLVEAISEQLGIPRIDFRKSPVFEEALKLLDKNTCQKYAVLPVVTKTVRNQRQLMLAMADPTSFDIIREIEFRTASRVVPVVAPESMIMKAIDYCYTANGVRAQGLGQFLSRTSYADEPIRIVGEQEFDAPKAPMSPASPFANPEEVEKRKRVTRRDPALLALIELLVEKGYITRREIEVTVAKYSSK